MLTIRPLDRKRKHRLPRRSNRSSCDNGWNPLWLLLMEDGNMVEIPYEIKDGKLTFEIAQMGVFALVPVEASETK